MFTPQDPFFSSKIRIFLVPNHGMYTRAIPAIQTCTMHHVSYRSPCSNAEPSQEDSKQTRIFLHQTHDIPVMSCLPQAHIPRIKLFKCKQNRYCHHMTGAKRILHNKVVFAHKFNFPEPDHSCLYSSYTT